MSNTSRQISRQSSRKETEYNLTAREIGMPGLLLRDKTDLWRLGVYPLAECCQSLLGCPQSGPAAPGQWLPSGVVGWRGMSGCSTSISTAGFERLVGQIMVGLTSLSLLANWGVGSLLGRSCLSGLLSSCLLRCTCLFSFHSSLVVNISKAGKRHRVALAGAVASLSKGPTII
ncbi:MAG: hypothetical protein FRX49_09953 [Trebouxia sp. A1-2]|nr:MAG: hypothetical protein FRX49_09953 [Trebouxia sp. A1-2]